MSKVFNKQVLKFEITEDKLKMEMKLEDLEFLFDRAEGNFNGNEAVARIKEGKKQEFAEFVVKFLMDDEHADSNNVNWGVPFERAFDSIFEGAEDEIVDYTEED